MQNKITAIIQSVTPLPNKSIEKIQALIHYVNIEKGDSIAKVGDHNNLEYFVIEGICKTYLNNPEGEEVTLSFFLSQSIISPYTTRTQNGNSILNIKALTSMEIATIDAGKFEQLMIEDLEIREFGNTVLRNELMNKVQKEIGLASLTSKNRLKILRKQYPNIENLISHASIASYLGITTISLSRLRAQP